MTGSSCACVEPAVDAVPGQGRLTVSRVDGRSVVTRAYATSPLRLLTPANHGHAAWIYTSSYGGGLVDGDRLALDIEVAAGASAFVSTQASTKVYRSPRGTAVVARATVGDGAFLVWAPDPVVCFAGAHYRQHQRFDIAEGGALVYIDILVSGRHAAGERWSFANYHSLLEVRSATRRILHEATRLSAEDGDLARRHGRFDAFAWVVVSGAPLADEALRVVTASAGRRVGARADQIVTAAPLRQGCIVRIASTSTERVVGTLRDVLRFVPARLGDDPWKRKW